MKLRPCAFLFLACIAGCGSSSASPAAALPDASTGSDDASAPTEDASSPLDATPGGEDAANGSAEAAAGDAGDTGAPCNSIANTAPVISTTQVAQDPPTPAGGTIADGTYWATSIDIYTGPNGPTGVTGTSATTALIQGQTVQLVSTGQPTRRTITLTTADAGFTSVDTCPAAQTSQGGYTATATTLMIFLDGGTDDAGARTVVETLTKQ
jgi:hypothetical protein